MRKLPFNSVSYVYPSQGLNLRDGENLYPMLIVVSDRGVLPG